MNLSALRIVIIACAVSFVQRAAAVDFHVTTAQELQNALTFAAANGADDNIYLAAGYYTGNFNFNSTENRSLVLQGEVGTTNTQVTIDGAGTGRDMNLANSGTGNFTVRGITFMRNCGDASFGALRIAAGAGSALFVDSCRFLSPSTSGAFGSGLDIVSGQNATITNCIAIGKDTSVGDGVRIQGVSGNLTIGGNTLSTNTTGLYCPGGSGRAIIILNNLTGNTRGVTLDCNGGVTFLGNNMTKNYGWGASLAGQSDMQVANNVFKNNTEWYYSGGCSATSRAGLLVVSNNIFSQNVGHGDGSAGIFGGTTVILVGNSFDHNAQSFGSAGTTVSLNSQATITGNSFVANLPATSVLRADGAPKLIAGNTFIGNTGGLLCSDSSTISNNTFIGNSYGVSFSGSPKILANLFKQNTGAGLTGNASALVLGDNLMVKNGLGVSVSISTSLIMVNNTVTDNVGGGLSCSVGGVVEVLNVYNNIVWGNGGTDVTLAGTGARKMFAYNNVHSMSGVWDIAANNIDLAPAFFDPVTGDYHLRGTSPCINSGTNGVPSLPSVDLDGNARTNAATVDIGAYEYDNTRFHPADVNQDWSISATEFTNYAIAWKNSQNWPSGPGHIPADYVTRAGLIQNKGGTYHNDGASTPFGWKPGTN